MYFSEHESDDDILIARGEGELSSTSVDEPEREPVDEEDVNVHEHVERPHVEASPGGSTHPNRTCTQEKRVPVREICAFAQNCLYCYLLKCKRIGLYLESARHALEEFTISAKVVNTDKTCAHHAKKEGSLRTHPHLTCRTVLSKVPSAESVGYIVSQRRNKKCIGVDGNNIHRNLWVQDEEHRHHVTLGTAEINSYQ